MIVDWHWTNNINAPFLVSVAKWTPLRHRMSILEKYLDISLSTVEYTPQHESPIDSYKLRITSIVGGHTKKACEVLTKH